MFPFKKKKSGPCVSQQLAGCRSWFSSANKRCTVNLRRMIQWQSAITKTNNKRWGVGDSLHSEPQKLFQSTDSPITWQQLNHFPKDIIAARAVSILLTAMRIFWFGGFVGGRAGKSVCGSIPSLSKQVLRLSGKSGKACHMKAPFSRWKLALTPHDHWRRLELTSTT